MYRPGGTEWEGKVDKVVTGAGWVRRVVDSGALGLTGRVPTHRAILPSQHWLSQF